MPGLTSPIVGMARLYFPMSLLGIAEFDSPLSLKNWVHPGVMMFVFRGASLESSMSVSDHSYFGLSPSVQSLARIDPAVFVLDSLHSAFALSLRSFTQPGSSASPFGRLVIDSVLFVLDFLHLDSGFSMRSSACLGFPMFVLDSARLGSFTFIREILHLEVACSC